MFGISNREKDFNFIAKSISIRLENLVFGCLSNIKCVTQIHP